MKKLIMMMALAVGLTGLAAQNDPTFSVEVEKDATYDVLCKGEKLFSFTSNKTGRTTVQGVAAKSMNAGDYQVSLLSATPEQEANGGETSGSGDELSIASVADLVCKYADGKVVLQGERCVLVSSAKDAGFQGLNWDGTLVDDANNEIVKTFNAGSDGKFSIEIDALSGEKVYDLIVLDTRMPDGSLAPAVADNPKLVNGWGEFVFIGSETTIRWNAVKIGRAASYRECGKTFDYDPSKNLEQGLAAVYDGTDWKVYELPKAYAEIVDNGVVSSSDGYAMLCDPRDVNPAAELSDPFTLDVTYKFLAFKEEIKKVVDAISPLLPKDEWGCANFKDMDAVNAAAAQAVLKGDITEAEANAAGDFMMRVMPFWGWNCDFEVSFDRPIKRGTYVLGGHYQQAKNFGFDGWVCSAYENDLVQGESVRLLKDNNYKGVYVTYYEICSRVQEFLCGVINLSPENYGTTMTVKLCIYDNYGRDNENGGRIEIGTYRYAFRGPLNVKFYENEAERTDLAISTNHAGTCEIQLPALKGDATTAFVGWSNRVSDVVYTNSLPARTWTPDGSCLDLYATWKAAQVVVVSNETSQIKDQDIKVTEDWIKDVLKVEPTEKETVQEKLNEPVGTDTEKGTMKKWEAYVLGLDATDPNASVKVDQTAGAQEDKAIVLSTVQAPPPDSGFKVAYSLDKVEDNEETVKKTVDERTTNDLTIDLEPTDGETPTGYYKMNVIVTPDGADPIKYPAENTIGVLKVESEEKLVPVAVPWLSLEKGEEVLPNEIVDSRTLSEGDKLHVYNDNVSGQKDIYSTWIISGGAWVPVETVKIDNALQSTVLTKAAAREGSVRCGKGAWLERVDTTRPFYLIGQYDKAEEVSVQIKPPAEEGKVEYNLIAPTGIEDTDLNEIPSLTSADVDSKDQLMVMNKGVPTFLRPHEVSEGKTEWGYYKSVIDMSRGYPVVKQVWSTEAARVSAGLGLWYISSGGTPRIVWKEGKTEESK